MPDPANFTCPRRIQDGRATAGGPFVGSGPNLDSYVPSQGLADQKAGCSYCGSMDPTAFMRAVREHVEIGPTDKSYKLYVGEMAGKFYTQHFSTEQADEFDQLWREHKINWGYPYAPYVPLYLPGFPKSPVPEPTS